MRAFRHLSIALGKLGPVGTARLATMHLLDRLGIAPDTFQLQPPGVSAPVTLRKGGSDLIVYFQVFIGAYEQVRPDNDLEGLILDCGANVGLASVYLLERFPKCRVLALEPDPDNYRQLVENTRRFGNRIITHQSGLWSHPARLGLRSADYRDGRDWARQVVEVSPDDPNGFDSVDIPTLLAIAGADRVALLKMDIEGAEAVIFGDDRPGALDWLDAVDNLAVELHDDTSFGPASPSFRRVLARYDGDHLVDGDLDIVRNLARKKTSKSPEMSGSLAANDGGRL